MSKIKVLFENNQFQQTKYMKTNYKYASDITLNGMLASCSMAAKCFDERKTDKTKNKNYFHKHPRILDDDLVDSSEEYSDISFESQEKRTNQPIYDDTTISSIKHESAASKIFESKNKNCIISKACDKFNEHVPSSSNLINGNNFSPKQSAVVSKVFDNKDKRKTIPEVCNKFRNEPKPSDNTTNENMFSPKQSSMFSKINDILDDIRQLLQAGVQPVESPDDYMRREKKAVEFASRLSRNYLYQLGRQIIEFQKLLKLSCKSKPNISQQLSLNQRLLNIHQTIIQALQTYCSYIPTSLETKSTIKLNELILNIIQVCSLTRRFRTLSEINSPCTIIDEVENNCKLFKDRDILNVSVKPQQVIPKPKASKTKINLTSNVPQQSIVPFHKKESLANRLSMYNAPQKLPRGSSIWKRSTMVLAKQRFNVQSRYKIINDKKSLVVPPKNNIEETKSVKISASKSFVIPEKLNEDEIVTMIELQKKRKQEAKSKSAKTPSEMKLKLQPLLRYLLNEINKEEVMDQSISSDVLDNLKGILNQMQNLNTSDTTDNSIPSTDKSSKISDAHKKNVIHKSNITVTGPKNAQLICIKDKSCFEPESEISMQVKIDAPLQTNCDNKKEVDKPGSDKKQIETTHNSSRCLPNLPKKFAINIIQYKIEFHKYTKPNHMYQKTLYYSPWLLTSKISDQLLDSLLGSVLQEIEFNHVVEKLYRSEFV